MFPVVNGFCTFLRPPWSTERRMALQVEEVVLVTRYQKYVVLIRLKYGENAVSKQNTFNWKEVLNVNIFFLFL